MHHNKSNKNCEYEVGYPNKNPCTCTCPQPPAMSAPEEETWETELRNYIDKTLKPKKAGIKNLDREIIISFVDSLLATDRARLIEEGRNNAQAEMIVDLYEIRASFQKPMHFRELGNVDDIVKYNFFNATIANLCDKYNVNEKTIREIVQKRSLLSALNDSNK